MLSDYEGLPLEKAIAKLKAKPFHDEQDLAFVRAREEYFTPAEFAAITGGAKAEAPADEAAPSDATAATPEAEPAEGDVNPDKFKLDELQAQAAELGLDTAGTKKELAARISEARKSA